jgi:hypothetical protein
VGKHAVAHHTRDVVDTRFHGVRLVDPEVVHVENAVAVVRHHALAQHRVASQAHQLAGHVTACHGDDLDGQGKGAEHGDSLAVIGDAEEHVGDGGDDLFAGQRAAAALDQLQRIVGLVGAVHVSVHAVDAVQVVDGDAVTAQSLGARLGAGHGAVEKPLAARQGVDEAVGGGAGADSDDRVRLQLRVQQLQRRLRRRLFPRLQVHGFSAIRVSPAV